MGVAMTIKIGDGFEIITRAEWGARKYDDGKSSPTIVPWSSRVGVAVHYQAGNVNSGPKSLQNYAMDSLGYPDSHYNFAIKERTIWEMRGATVKAAHSTNNNTAWIGVVSIGGNVDVDSDEMAAMTQLHRWLEGQAGKKLQSKGHRQLPGASGTACPGSNWLAWLAAGGPNQTPPADEEEDMAKLEEFIAARQRVLRDAGYYTGQIDSVWGPVSEAADAACCSDARKAQRVAQVVISGTFPVTYKV